MFVAGGAVNGGIRCCGPSVETYNGKNISWNVGNGGQNGDMFGASNRYLKRAVDYRSILGEIIRDHLYDEVVKLEFFKEGPDEVRGRWTGIGIAGLVGIVLLLVLLVNTFGDGIWGVWPLAIVTVLLSLGLIGIAKIMPRRTDKGAGS